VIDGKSRSETYKHYQQNNTRCISRPGCCAHGGHGGHGDVPNVLYRPRILHSAGRYPLSLQPSRSSIYRGITHSHPAPL